MSPAQISSGGGAPSQQLYVRSMLVYGVGPCVGGIQSIYGSCVPAHCIF